MTESKSSLDENPKLSVVTLMGFKSSLRFLQSQILCKLYKSPLDETK